MFGSKYWENDGKGHPYPHICKDTGKTITRQPAYTDPKIYTGSSSTGVKGNKPGSLIDAPTERNVFLIKAYCRCECADDKFLEETTYTAQGRIGK